MKPVDYMIGVALLVAAIGLGVVFVVTQNNDDSSDLVAFGQSFAFDFSHPTNWVSQIPEPNLVIAAPPRTLSNEEPGPNFTVGRALGGLGDDLIQGFLDTRIFSDTVAFGQEWEIIGERQDLTIDDDHEAQSILLEGRATPDGILLRQEIFATRGDNNVVYVFVTAAPAEDWEDYDEVFDDIIDSIEIND